MNTILLVGYIVAISLLFRYNVKENAEKFVDDAKETIQKDIKDNLNKLGKLSEDITSIISKLDQVKTSVDNIENSM